MKSVKLGLASGLAVALLSSTSLAAGGSAEVMHFWTSGGEAKALQVLKEEFEKTGGKWKDTPVAGGGGEAARTTLKARVQAGDPPTSFQMHMGPNVWEWAEAGALGSIDDIAKQEKWDDILPPLVANMVKYDGKYVAAPVNIHKINWLWINKSVFDKAGVAVPTTWDEFNQAAEKIQKAGFIAVAHGGQPWQDLTIFDTVALGVGGADYYRKAFVELDPEALGSDTTKKVFDQFRKIRGFVDKDFPNRDWNLATSMVIQGKAAMQIMGDWAKGEFTAAGKKIGTDPAGEFICAPTPGSADAFSLNNDSFAMFDVKGDEAKEGQQVLASLIMGEKFQEVFNIYKGSIPARLGVKRDNFDSCAILSMDTLDAATKENKVVPSLSAGLANSATAFGAIQDVVTQFFNSDMSSDEATKKLVEAVKAAQ